MIKIKRIYEPYDGSDGYRVLVDALWPRGISKDRARLDEWLKEIAPSAELRKQFHKQPELWPVFQKSYRAELATPDRAADLKRLRDIAQKQTLTLLYASARQPENNATVLFDVLRGK